MGTGISYSRGIRPDQSSSAAAVLEGRKNNRATTRTANGGQRGDASRAAMSRKDSALVNSARVQEQFADYAGQVAAIRKSQAVIEFSMDGTILDANANFLKALGYTLEEVQGRHHGMFVDEAFRESVAYKEFWARLNRGEFQTEEYKLKSKGGKEVWFQAFCNPILDISGKPFKVVKYATDVTPQKLALNAMSADVALLTKAAVEGKLATRADASKHQGNFRKAIEGVNAMLDAVIGPLNVSAEYVNRMSKGDIPPKITDSYNGDFNELKNNLNTCIDAVNALVADAGVLSKAAVEGKLATRADASKHQGDYRKIVEGVNFTVSTLVGHLDSMPTPAMIIDREFNIQFINKVGAQVGGMRPEDVIGSKCYDHFKTSDCRTDRCACSQAMRREQGATSETVSRPVQAVELDIAYTGVPIRDESGKVIGALEVVTDQTAVKKAARLAQKVADFQATETEKLGGGLVRLAQGDTTVKVDTAEGDADTAQVRETFAILAEALNTCVTSVSSMVTDADFLSKSVIEGKLGARADVSKHVGDYRKIVEGINRSLDMVVEPLKVTAQNAIALASSSEELTAVSQQMAGNAEETATQANVVSAASEQVSMNVTSVASAAEEMQASIREIAKNANESARVAKNAVNVAHTTNETVKKLGESSQEIGNVIKVITSIAQQTNLLALNATIEAARAGEAGKGFAVVANEVKELAKQTAKATGDIGQKIEAIQGNTKGAVKAIEEIGAIINQINDISNSIASAVEEQTATTNEIGKSVTEAAAGVGDIAKNIGGVALAAKNTTQGANDTQKASQELSHMAAQLQKVISRFTF